MSDRRPVTVRVDRELWARFEKFVAETEDETRGAKPKHLEHALRAYLDEDREARIEDKVDDILTHLRENSGNTHTHARTGASETVEKTREIAERIIQNHANEVGVVARPDVERAIKDIGGGDPRTVNKYEIELKQRGLLYEHPGDSGVWTADFEEFVRWMESYIDAVPDAKATDLLEPYPMDVEAYDAAVAEFNIT